MKRKFLAVLLSLALALTACPFAFATEADFTPVPEVTPAASESAPVTTEPVVTTDANTDATTEPTTDTDATVEPTTNTDTTVEPTTNTDATVEPDTNTDATTEPTTNTDATTEPTTNTDATVEPTTNTDATVEPDADADATTEPTDEPEAVRVAMTADKPSVLAGSEKIELTLSVSGGQAPYSVVVTSAQGEAVLSSETLTLNEAGEIVWGADAAPEMGTQSLTAAVTDALGQTATAKVELPVAEKISEDVAATVRSIELTGDWAQDLIAIAESQIGYQESETSFRIDADGRQHGYTRYGLWYGNAYGEWCGMFVSFCLNYAKIPEADFPREANCIRWRSALKAIAVYEDDEDAYTPAPGDLIFFDITGETDDPGHVGIVARVDGDTIYTIEGNQNRAVRKMEYKKDDKTIVGYASMARIIARAAVKTATDQPAETDYSAIEGREGVMTGDKVNIRAAASKDSEALGQTGVKGETVTLIAAETNESGETWFRLQYGEITGYIRSDFVFIAAAEPTVEPAADEAAAPEDDAIVPGDDTLTPVTHIEGCGEDCALEGCACPCHGAKSLYERFMACKTLEELDAVAMAATEEELATLTDEENAEIDALYDALTPEPLPAIDIGGNDEIVQSEIVYEYVTFTNVAPFGAPVTGGKG